jgi:hypothetical protein
MKQSEKEFREDTRAMQRLAWVLWSMAEPAATPGAGKQGRFVAVQQLREAAQQVWREAGRRVTNGGPGLLGLPARINAAVCEGVENQPMAAAMAGRRTITKPQRWIINHYKTQEDQRANYNAADYYRLRFEPPEVAPLNRKTGPDVLPFVDPSENGQDDELQDSDSHTLEHPPRSGEPLGRPAIDLPETTVATPRGADVLLMAQKLKMYDHMAREELTAAALELASAMDRTGLQFTTVGNGG